MCGISGVYEHQAGDLSALLSPMLHIISHRGPDDSGEYHADNIAMGMRRLSIIDLAGGHQPIYNEDQTVVIVFNGEIYNYRLLRSDLEKRGHQFATNSDTEVIVHLYEEYGVECVTHLRGMFAFAVWDTRKQQLLIARDHLGIKPLYYTQLGDRLIFSSEIKSILEHPGVERSLNIEAMSDYLSLRYVATPKTMFQNIYGLPSGHRLIANGSGIHIEQYWNVEFYEPETRLSDDEYIDQLEALVSDAVKMRLMSDVPFGAFLSGGVDSSTVVALMTKFMNEPVKTFTVGYEGEGTDEFAETRYAQKVAEHFQTQHHEVIVTGKEFVDLAQDIVWHLDQPIADPAEVAYFSVARLASQHVKMVLTGEGGDELFAGYTYYVGESYAPMVSPVLSPFKSLILSATEKFGGPRRPKDALIALSHKDAASRYLNWIPHFNSHRKSLVLSKDLRARLGAYDSSSAPQYFMDHVGDNKALNQLLYTDTKLWLPDYLLSRGDKLTMANSLEGRVPLLDYKLVEFAAHLPIDLKLHGKQRKWLLKQVARRYLPPEIIDRKKQGFPIPVPVWLRGYAHDFMRDTLSSAKIKERGLFDPAYVETLIQQHESGFADHATMLYGLISLELWHQLFIDHQTGVTADQPVAVQGISSE